MDGLKEALAALLGPEGLRIFTNLNLGFTAVLFFVTYVALLLYTIDRGRKGLKIPKIRRIAGLDAIDEVVGRATEMGRPIAFVPGIGGFTAGTFAGLGIMSYVTKLVAKFDSRLIVFNCEPNVFPVAQSTVRQAYLEAGKPDSYREDDVRYITDSQFGFATGVAGQLIREMVSGQVMFGTFYAESIIFAETGNSIGAIQVAGTDMVAQIPFFVSSCDYTLLGEEIFAASAYLTQDRLRVSTLVVQDWGKMFLVGLIFLGIISATFAQFTGAPSHFIRDILTLY